MKIKPFGSWLLVQPLESKNFITENKIEIVETGLAHATVVEVSDEFSEVLKPGDVVVHTKDAGKPQYYNGKPCLWIDARSPDKGGDCWFLIVDEGVIPEIKHLDERELRKKYGGRTVL